MDELRRRILHTVQDLLEEATTEPEKVMAEAARQGATVTELLAAEIIAGIGLLLRHHAAPWAGD